MIVGSNTILKPVKSHDLDLVFAWENNPEMWPISETPGPFDMETIRAFIDQSKDLQSQKQQRWMIHTKSDKPVGMIDLFQYNPYTKTCGIGLMIAYPADRRLGYATDAVLTLMEYLENKSLVNQVNALIFEDNLASQKLFLKCDFLPKSIKFYKGKRAIQYTKKILQE